MHLKQIIKVLLAYTNFLDLAFSNFLQNLSTFNEDNSVY